MFRSNKRFTESLVWEALRQLAVAWPRLKNATTAFFNSLLGAAILGCALCIGIGEFEAEWICLVVVVTGFVAGISGIMRLVGFRIAHLSELQDGSPGTLQFTIRGFLLVTFVVACLLSLGRMFAPWFPPLHVVIGAIVLAIGFATIAVSALRGALAQGTTRITTACLAALGTGAVVYYVVEVSNVDPGILWFIIVLVYSAMLIASLMAFRRCGYRLVRSTGEHARRPE